MMEVIEQIGYLACAAGNRECFRFAKVLEILIESHTLNEARAKGSQSARHIGDPDVGTETGQPPDRVPAHSTVVPWEPHSGEPLVCDRAHRRGGTLGLLLPCEPSDDGVSSVSCVTDIIAGDRVDAIH